MVGIVQVYCEKIHYKTPPCLAWFLALKGREKEYLVSTLSFVREPIISPTWRTPTTNYALCEG